MARRILPILKHLTSRPAITGSRPEPGSRSVTYMPRPGDGAPWAVTLIPGDGIGPLVTSAVEQAMEAMHAPVYFERYEVHGDMKRAPQEVLDSIRKNKVCLKGGLKTPVGGGVSSLIVQLRKELDLYASLVNCFNLPGLPTRHESMGIVMIRENTEGEYSGLEHEVVPGVVESLKYWTCVQDHHAQQDVCNSRLVFCAPFSIVPYLFNIHEEGALAVVKSLYDLVVTGLSHGHNLLQKNAG